MIREFVEADVDAVVDVWLRSGKGEYTYLPNWQAATRDEAHAVFLEKIAAACRVWVGVHEEAVVAYLAMNGSYIDRLYVDPSHQHKGWGTRFIDHAKALRPKGLELHTHQQNVRACAFYEKRGFVAVRFGKSPEPEFAPDVEYHWRPS